MPYVGWNGFQVDPENIPQNSAGAYRFTNLVNGKFYIGISVNVLGRCNVWAKEARPKIEPLKKNAMFFTRALQKYGAQNFLLEPILYSIEPIEKWTDNGTWLKELETELIIEHDSIKRGYNSILRWQGGLSGLRSSIRAQMSESAKARERTLEFEEKRLAACRTPESKAKNRAAKLGHKKSPESIEKLKATLQLPEINAKLSAGRRGKPVSDEQKAKQRAAMLLQDNSRLHTPEAQAKAARNRKGRIWITDGVNGATIMPGDPIPEGWRKGRNTVGRPAHNKGVPASEEQREKLRQAALIQFQDPVQIERNRQQAEEYWAQFTSEQRSEMMRARLAQPETRAKMSSSAQNRRPKET